MTRRQQFVWGAAALAGLLGLVAVYQAIREPPQRTLFEFHASGFNATGVADSQGRVLHLEAAQPRRLAPDRWVAIDLEDDSSVWFDDSGRVLARLSYAEIDSQPFQRNPDDPDQSPLWKIWSNDRVSLVTADGSLPLPWQDGHGDWQATAHPGRIVWAPRSGGEVVFDWRGRERLRLTDEGPRRVSGPFPNRALYLLCDDARATPCALRDEDGATLFEAPIDELRELDNGRWLARQGEAWRQLDARGQPVGDRLYTDSQHSPRFRTPETDSQALAWPIWITAYGLAEDGISALPLTEAQGFMRRDGSFHPVAGAQGAYELCPGTWRVNDAAEEPRYWLVDDQGQPLGPMLDDGWQPVEGHPDRLIAYKEGRQEALVDCRGKRLFEDPRVRELDVMGAGFAGILADEQAPRVWIDAQLRQHLLPEGSRIQQADPDGGLLLVQQEQGMRLYNLAQEAFVGEVFDHAQDLTSRGVIFNREGYYGLMDGQGRELLAPEYYEVLLWGDDRIWSRRYLADGVEGSVSRLHDGTGRVLGRWEDMSIELLPTWLGDADTRAVSHLVGKTFLTEQGAYFPQQWVDRDGVVLMTALTCPGEDLASVLADGPALLESQGQEPRRHGGRCEMPAPIRAAIAMRPGKG
ncbi:MAG: hypothetical protein V4812_19195 [Pseudomonadota bacterium]